MPYAASAKRSCAIPISVFAIMDPQTRSTCASSAQLYTNSCPTGSAFGSAAHVHPSPDGRATGTYTTSLMVCETASKTGTLTPELQLCRPCEDLWPEYYSYAGRTAISSLEHMAKISLVALINLFEAKGKAPPEGRAGSLRRSGCQPFGCDWQPATPHPCAA